MILDKNVYILSMQETNVQINLDHELISFPGYKYETETNTVKARVGAFVSSKLNYVRRHDLKGVKSFDYPES
jgi:hypothetical protein